MHVTLGKYQMHVTLEVYGVKNVAKRMVCALSCDGKLKSMQTACRSLSQHNWNRYIYRDISIHLYLYINYF